MIEREVDNEPIFEANRNITDVLGIMLVIGGIAISLWVFLHVYNIFTNPQELIRFQQLISSNLEMVLSSKSKEFGLLIPPEILAYGIPVILLMIAVGVGRCLIMGGVNLLYGSFQRMLNRISALEFRIGNKIERIKDKLRGIDVRYIRKED